MLKQACLTIVLLAAPAIVLPGCVNVTITAHSNGALTKKVRVEVESSHENLAWQEIRQNLARPRQGWTLKKSHQGQNTVIIAAQSLPDANLAPNTSLHLQRTGWITRRYEYRERLPLAQYAASPSAKAVASAIPVSISLTMPGRIAQSPGATLSGNRATWNFHLGEEEILLQATSSQNRYCMATWSVIVLLLALAALAAWVRERFSK